MNSFVSLRSGSHKLNSKVKYCLTILLSLWVLLNCVNTSNAASGFVLISSAAFNGGYADKAASVVIDGSDNIIVTGLMFNGADADYFTIKYNSNLSQILSSATYDSGFKDEAGCVTVDMDDNIIVTGSSKNGVDGNLFTIKYSPELLVITSATFNSGTTDYANAVAVDPSGNIIVAGYAQTGSASRLLMVKYNSDFSQIISSLSTGGSTGDAVNGVDTDDSGNIIVTGRKMNKAYTAIYNPSLVLLGSVSADDMGSADSAVLDSQGNIIITGKKNNGSNYDFLTIKYNSDLSQVLSSATYDSGSADYAQGAVVDECDNVIVAGFKSSRILTFKYSPELLLISSAAFPCGINSQATGVDVDSKGNIIVTGYDYDFSSSDYLTLSYSNPFKVTLISPTTAYNSNCVFDASISGSGFMACAEVKVTKAGETDIYANDIDLINASNIACKLDLLGAATGLWNVVVSTGGPGSAYTIINSLRISSMTITAVTPNSVYNSTSAAITNLAGCGFVSGSAVRLTKTGESDINARNVQVVNSSQITCTLDLAGKTSGYWNVVVSTAGTKTTSAVLANGFQLLGMEVTSLIPSSVYNSSSVFISNLSGKGFVSGSTVKLTKQGEIDIAARNVSFVNSTKLTCIFDLTGKPTGYWNVVVSTGGPGSHNAVLNNGLLVNAMNVASITPNNSYNSAAVSITNLSGNGFVMGSIVKLAKSGEGDIIASNVNTVNQNQITCKFSLEGKATGYWDVIISTGGAGSVSAVLAGGFLVNPMSISSLNPNSGANNGLLSIMSIDGSGFVAGSTVTIRKTGQSDIKAVDVHVFSGNWITCQFNLSNAATGYWDVIVATGGPGSYSVELANGLFLKLISVGTCMPDTGYNTGPIAITNLSGGGFTANTQVRLTRTGESEIAATNVNALNPNQLTCNFDITAKALGYWDICVSTGGPGSETSVTSDGFLISSMSVFGITPGIGYNSGKVSITSLAGSGFVTGSAVKLTRTGETAVNAGNVSVTGPNQITCTFDLTGKSTGYWDVIVSTGGDGSITAVLDDGLFVSTMAVNSIGPVSQYNSINALVSQTISGRGFVAGSEVKFTKQGQDDIVASNVVVVNSAQITCYFNPACKATGYWDVIVSTGGPGSISAALEGKFQIIPMYITSISPSTGCANGSVLVNFFGGGFTDYINYKLVKAGEADIIGINDAIHYNKPTFDLTDAATGYWDVLISTGEAGSTVLLLQNYFFISSMTITSITPSTGYNSGPVLITNLAGEGFTDSSIVKLTKTGQSDIIATNVDAINSGRIMCNFDLTNKATGYWNVTVSTGGAGSRTVMLSDGFLISTMTITSMSLNIGYNSGVSQTIYIYGAGFVTGAGRTQAKLVKSGENDINAINLNCWSGSSLSCKFSLTNAATGYWDVVVSTGGAGSISARMDGYFLVSTMSIASISPSEGFNSGSVPDARIDGCGFVTGSQVQLVRSGEDDINATNISVSGYISCKFNLKGAATGYWDVVVSTGGPGSISARLDSCFLVSTMSITSMSPNKGYQTDSSPLCNISGKGFMTGSQVKLKRSGQNDISTWYLNVVSSTQISCRFALAGAATGYWDVVVSTDGSTATLYDGFLISSMAVNSLSPASACNNGFVSINFLQGAGFVSGSKVKLVKSGQADIIAPNVSVYSSTWITCKFDLSGKATGYWDVIVSTGGAGSITAVLCNGFLVDPMTVTSVAPSNYVSGSGVLPLTMTGTGFLTGSRVKIAKSGRADVFATDVNVINASNLSCSFNLTGAATGYWDVIVSTGTSGSATATLYNGLFISSLSVCSITPSSAYNNSTVSITNLEGSGFQTGSTVKLSKSGQSDINGSNVTVLYSTQIACDINLTNAPTGYWDVVVSTGGPASMSAVLSNGFYVNSIAISSITPNSGYNSGSVNITNLSGSGFVTGSTVKLTKSGQSDIDAANVAVICSTQITCAFDLTGKSRGYWSVVVSTGGAGSASAALNNGFQISSMTVTDITPRYASNNGSVSITNLGGNGFVEGSTVKLMRPGESDINATAVTVVSPTQITCTFDLNGKGIGNYDVVVTTSGVTSTFTNGFNVSLAGFGPANSPWPMYRQNSYHTGASTITASGSVGVLQWSVQTSSAVTSSPCIGPDGTIYVGSEDSYLYAICSTGTVKWKYQTGSAIGSSPAIGSDGTVFVGGGDNDGYLYAINPGGTLKWKSPDYNAYPAVHSPVIGPDGVIYYINDIGYLNSVNPDGTLNWEEETSEVVGVGASPAIGPDGMIYVARFDDYLYAINPAGQKKAIYDFPADVTTDPAIGPDGTIYAGRDDHNLIAYYPGSSQCTWKYLSIGYMYSDPAIGPDGTVYVGSNYYLTAVNSDGSLKWAYNVGGLILSSPAVGPDGTVYVGSWDNYLYAINSDGTLKWKYQTGNWVFSSPSIGADGTVYFGSSDNNVYAIKVTNPPALSWTGEPNYISDGIDPEVVFTTSAFNFRVTYSDADDEAPASGYPKLHVKKGGSEIEGSPFTMSYVSGNNNTGAIYAYSKTIDSFGADYTYYFEAYDVWGATATGFPASATDSPDLVTPAVTSIVPALSCNSGPATITNLAGNGWFVAGSTVKLVKSGESDIAATGVVVENAGKITCAFDLTGKATGYWDIVVSTGGAASTSATLSNGFQISPIVITSVSPGIGYNTGPLSISNLAGEGFVLGSKAKITKSGQNDIIAANIVVVSSKQITCDFTLAGAATGYWDVVVATGGAGSVQGVLTDGLLIKPMEITSITLNSIIVPATKIDETIIEGNGFVEGSQVKLSMAGRADVGTTDSIAVSASSKLTFKFSTDILQAATGYWDVVVSTGGPGSLSATLANGFLVEMEKNKKEKKQDIHNDEDCCVTIKPESGDVTVDIPSDTFGQDVALTVAILEDIPETDRSTIKVTRLGLEITNDKELQPNKDITITVSYRDSDIEGLDEAKLTLARYDTEHARWIPIPTVVYADLNKMIGTVKHLSKFAVVQLAPASDLDAVKVFPNPYNPNNGNFTIDNLTATAEIKIFTITGELVREVEYTSGNSRAIWDGKNSDGSFVASGVYIVFVKNADGKKSVKLAVIK